jgi:DNA-directed RNA polymerase alpha subunit
MGVWYGYSWVDLDTDLAEIGLSKRAHRFLRRNRIKTVQELLANSDNVQRLAEKTFGVGPVTLEEVKGVTTELSLKFGKEVVAVLVVMNA